MEQLLLCLGELGDTLAEGVRLRLARAVLRLEGGGSSVRSALHCFAAVTVAFTSLLELVAAFAFTHRLSALAPCLPVP